MIKLGSKVVKPHRILGLCAGALLSQLTLADEPTVTAPALGMTEATLEFCAQVDPQSADRYQEQIKSMVKGVPEKTVAEIRNSDAYLQAHHSVTEKIAKIPRQDVARNCEESLVANR